MAIRLWKFLTDIREWDWKQATEVTKTGAESAKAVLDLAKTVNEKKADVAALKPYVENLSSLLDALNSPLAQIVKDSIPFAPIAVTILSLICEATKKEPTLEQCVALVVQAAYLESLRSQLQDDAKLLEQIGEVPVSQSVTQQIRKLGDLELDDREANQVLVSFQETQLAREFNQVLEARLQQSGLAEIEAKTIADRVSWTVPRYLNQAVADAADKVKPLAELYRNGGREVLERYQSLEDYLKREIEPKPDELIFNDRDLNLTFREIYVRLKAQPLDRDGRSIYGAESIDLETWVMQMLMNPDKQTQVLFIQGEAGRGKSVFCRMFSDRVRRELYPSFMPVVIRLRHLKHLENTLTQTLENYLENWNFVTGYSNWLTDKRTRFLFLLDGFDELLLEGRASGGLKEFLQQVEAFQHSSHHRFLITGRPLSLQGIERVISQTNNLKRIALERMDDQIQQQWIAQWSQKVGDVAASAFSQFLKSCPDTVKDDLSKEPLLLYLLARLYREGQLTMQMLAESNENQTKIAIYDAAISWVLETQREDQNLRLTGLEPQDLRQVLTEAALCVVQAGNECAPLSMLEARLSEEGNELIRQARQETNLNKDRSLNNLLTAFYIQPGSRDRAGSVEFTHKSFGEFLCAERLRDAIEDWTRPGMRREKFNVSTKRFREEIYDLLGSPVLSVEIIGYLTAMLYCSPAFDPVNLFNRLHDEFYLPWCDGVFIDELPDKNLPQQKMRSLREQLPNQENPLGIRQVDVYAGLNVMILLLELHRYAQANDELKDAIVFYPSGKPVKDNRTVRLRKIISYSDCVELWAFCSITGSFFANTNLDSANLDSANLTSANFINTSLKNASLINANFANTNLDSANLTSASLINANFANTNLDSANLTSASLAYASFANASLAYASLKNANLANANLANTNLDSANLTSASLAYAYLANANLKNANLANANLKNTNLRGICWNDQTNWEGVQGLETARNVPEDLKKQLGLE